MDKSSSFDSNELDQEDFHKSEYIEKEKKEKVQEHLLQLSPSRQSLPIFPKQSVFTPFNDMFESSSKLVV